MVAKDVLRLVSVFHLAEGYQIAGGQPGLSSRRDEDNNWFSIAKLFDMIVSGLIHSRHSRAVMLLTEAFEMYLYWNRPYVGSKVEESVFVSSKPFSDVSSVGHGS